ncbi:MAG: HlyD family efflux transporter periplasmic adaptor subunit [Planctomycetaceae bacterium]|nr:HlyD family efflux transporter periplasmic adaptor subunit [Planctomycetaceae bacterium]
MMPSLGKSLLPLLMVFAGCGGLLLAQEPIGGSRRITATDCLTQFVDKLIYSSERVGVLTIVPREGDWIEPDQVVIQLSDKPARAALATAQARAENVGDIRVSEKAAAAAWLEHQAALNANEQAPDPRNPPFPETSVLRLRLTAEGADARIEQAKEEKRVNELTAEQAREELLTYQVRSQMQGIVTHVYKQAGQGVQTGEQVLEVVNIDKVRVEGYVTVDESYLVETGMPVEVRFTLPQATGESVVIKQTSTLGFVDVTVAPIAKRVRVWAEIPNINGRLKAGAKAEMEITVPAESN